MPMVLRGNAPELAKEEQMATSLPSSDDVSRRASLARPEGSIQAGEKRKSGAGVIEECVSIGRLTYIPLP